MVFAKGVEESPLDSSCFTRNDRRVLIEMEQRRRDGQLAHNDVRRVSGVIVGSDICRHIKDRRIAPAYCQVHSV
jgi:hypothetical protein